MAVVATGVPLATIRRVNQFAGRKLRRVTLNDLVHHMHRVYQAGEPAAFVNIGHWLHDELQVRFARQLMECYRLPYMVLMSKSFAEVHDMHLRTFEILSGLPEVRTGRDVLALSDALRHQFQNHIETVNLLRTGMAELRQQVDASDTRPLHGFMDRFLVTKIGNRVLAENFVNWLDRVETGNVHMTAPGVVNECKLAPRLRCVARAIGGLAESIYGQAPELVIDDVLDTEVPFIPAHVQFIFQEVLKNSVHATMEHHLAHGEANDSPPPVHIAIHPGKYDVEIKVSDRGGGMKRRVLKRLWEYGFSAATGSAEGAPRGASPLGTTGQDRQLKMQLAGYGVGMPISRLFARYFGGDMIFSSVYGYGTDVSIRIRRLGDHEELGCIPEDEGEEEDDR